MTEKEKAILEWMDEITRVLCYQVDIPFDHKRDLARKMDAVAHEFSYDKETN